MVCLAVETTHEAGELGLAHLILHTLEGAGVEEMMNWINEKILTAEPQRDS
jgi:hypothetical protein